MKNVILMLLCVASLSFAADVFDDFETYADTDAVLAADWVYRPTYGNADPQAPDGGKATFVLNTDDAISGSQSLQINIGNYDDRVRDWGFRANSGTWNWSSYDILQFHYKGDADVRVRIHTQWIPNIRYEKTFSSPATDQWVPVTVDLTSFTRSQVILLIFTVYDRTGSGTEVLFDNFLLGNDVFGSSVQPYYAGNPLQMQLSWFMADGQEVDEAYLRWAPEGEPFTNEIILTEPNDPFVGVMDVIPATNYKYQIEMNSMVKEGVFKSAYPSSYTWVIEDFESYTDSADMNANGFYYTPSNPSTTITLEESDSYDGTKSGKFYRTGYPDYYFAGFDFRKAPGGSINLLSYDKIRLWYRGDEANPTTGATEAGVMKLLFYDKWSTLFQEYVLPGKAAVIDGWTCVEYEIDDRWQWGQIGILAFHVRKNEFGAATIWIDRLEAVSEFSKPGGDINGDLAVNWLDMNYIVSDWLSDTIEVAEQTVVIEDFESYATEPTNWSYYYNATAPSVISLLTSGAYEGSKALRWDYDVETSIGNVYSEILYTLDSAVDLSQYDKVRIRVKRYLTNSEENSMYIKFLDSGFTNDNLSGKTYIPGATVAATDNWLDWEIDLHSLNYADGEPDYTQLSDITNLTAIMFGVIGNQGTGRIDMDSIRFVKDAECSVFLDGDINGDCVVNLIDYAIIANDWLTDLLAE